MGNLVAKNSFSSRRFTGGSLWEIFRSMGLSTHAYSQMVILNFQMFLHLSKIMWNTFSDSIGSSLHKKWSFPLRISSVNVTKFASFLRIWSHLLKKSLMGNFIFCAVNSSPDSNHFIICSKFSNSFHAAIVSSIFVIFTYLCWCQQKHFKKDTFKTNCTGNSTLGNSINCSPLSKIMLYAS